MSNREAIDNERAFTLIQSIAKGDENALTEFYRAFENRVYAFAMRRLEDPHLAAEVVNEVMFEIWRSAGRFEGRAKVSTWLFGIAHNKIMDKFRKKYRTENKETGLEDRIPDSGNLDMDEVMSHHELSSWLQHCLKKLSAIHQEVVHLAYFEDLSFKEISEMVGSPIGTIKTRMFYAKEALKPCLGEKFKQNS